MAVPQKIAKSSLAVDFADFANEGGLKYFFFNLRQSA